MSSGFSVPHNHGARELIINIIPPSFGNLIGWHISSFHDKKSRNTDARTNEQAHDVSLLPWVKNVQKRFDQLLEKGGRGRDNLNVLLARLTGTSPFDGIVMGSVSGCLLIRTTRASGRSWVAFSLRCQFGGVRAHILVEIVSVVYRSRRIGEYSVVSNSLMTSLESELEGVDCFHPQSLFKADDGRSICQ